MRPRRSSRIPLDLRALSGRVDIFRINTSYEHDPAVDDWFNAEDELRTLAKPWFEAMRGCGKDVRETFHDGCPVACIADAPFASICAFKHHVNVGFFYGALLPDPTHLLQGTGKRMRHVRLSPADAVDDKALAHLITAAYLDMKQRLRADEGAEQDGPAPSE